MKIHTAISAWKKIVGAEYVLTASHLLNSYETASFATHQSVTAIVQPANASELSAVLKIANQFEIPFYATSRGRNCGYGTRVPYQDGSAIVDLSRLNRISEYNEELAYVRLQAGVTQEQLYHFLKSKGDHLMMDPIATFADCSVIANILERGHGLTTSGDRIASGTDFEIVLPSGEIILTGYHAFQAAKVTNLDRWAPGPSLDGLFSQSNFGVVTEMTVWLTPKPQHLHVVAFTMNSQERFRNAIDDLRPLRLDGSIKFGPRFFNEYRLIETFSSYPWEKMNGKTPLSDVCLQELRHEMRIPLWLGIVGFHGTKNQIQADSELALRRIKTWADDVLIVDENTEPATSSQSAVERFVWTAYLGMKGNVGPVTQRPRWRKKTDPQSQDWSEDRCGIIWFPVSTPFLGEDATMVVNIIRESVKQFGFEPDMSVSAIRQRTLEVNSSIVFDRDDPTQEENAIPCVRHTLDRLAKAGYYPHRMGLPTMSFMKNMNAENRSLLMRLKKMFDPKELFAAGRYVE